MCTRAVIYSPIVILMIKEDNEVAERDMFKVSNFLFYLSLSVSLLAILDVVQKHFLCSTDTASAAILGVVVCA